MPCDNEDHHDNTHSEHPVTQLPRNQGGWARHVCAFCAYELGRENMLNEIRRFLDDKEQEGE